MMSTVPKITETHWLAASKKFTTGHTVMDVCNKAIEIALAEQKSIEMIRNIDIDWQESEYITAAQARELGAGNAEYRSNKFWVWQTCGENFIYWDTSLQYRAIKQAQPEPVEQWQENDNSRGFDKLAEKQSPELLIPVDPHATLRAEYIRQRDAVPCELGFYLWKGKNANSSNWHDATGCDIFFAKDCEYRYTDISCYVAKDDEITATRMLRTAAQELQRKLGDTVDWFNPVGDLAGGGFAREIFNFTSEGTYTYRTRATIKLDGNMVTPEQAKAEWKAKRETHERFVKWENADSFTALINNVAFLPHSHEKFEYELRPTALKQVDWTGSREDVIALLKEKELIK
jgi:hypothetical protein